MMLIDHNDNNTNQYCPFALLITHHSLQYIRLNNIRMIRVDRNAKLTGAQKGRILSLLYHDHGHFIAQISVLVQTTVKKTKVRRIALITIEY